MLDHRRPLVRWRLRLVLVVMLPAAAVAAAAAGRAAAASNDLQPLPATPDLLAGSPFTDVEAVATSAGVTVAGTDVTLVGADPAAATGAARAVATVGGLGGSRDDAALVAALNRARRLRGLPALTQATTLARAARHHAQSMGDIGYFSHDSRDGSPFWRRLLRYYPAAASSLWRVGEDLYWSAVSGDSAAIVQAWLASPEHRRVMLGSWTEVGAAIVTIRDAPGVFAGQDVTIAVADFGRRSR